MTNYETGKIYEIKIEDISNSQTHQPRKTIEDEEMGELKKSIQNKGLLIPILVKQIDGEIVILDGHRRFNACKDIKGIDTISAIFFDGDEDEISLIGNILRSELHPIDEAEQLDKIQKKHEYDQTQLGNIVGKKQSTISEILKINSLPKNLLKECRKDKWWSISKLLSIANIKNSDKQRKKIDELKNTKENLKGQRSPSTPIQTLQRRFKTMDSSFNRIGQDGYIEKLKSSEKSKLKKELESAKGRIEDILKKIKQEYRSSDI